MKKIVIAVDGYSSCGKSTLSKELAKHFHYNYIDTGAMYRSVTLFALENGLIQNGKVFKEALIKVLSEIHISFKYNNKDQKSDTYLNGKCVEDEIRGMRVSGMVSPIATIKEVREAMVKQQQAMGKEKGIVMDGRDIGTVVFPNAELKIFMTASAETRATRRYKELQENGVKASYEEILNNVNERDYIDENREESPLAKANDATVIDNGNMTREEQLNLAISMVHEHLK